MDASGAPNLEDSPGQVKDSLLAELHALKNDLE